MPIASNTRQPKVQLTRPERVAPTPRVNLQPIADLASSYLNTEFAGKKEEVLQEAQLQVAKESAANPTGFLQQPKPIPRNVFNGEIINQIRTENVLRGRNALAGFEAAAVAPLGDIDDVEAIDLPTNEVIDQSLEQYDSAWEKNIVPNIVDPQSLSTLTHDYIRGRHSLQLKIAAAKEKARRIRTRETAETSLNVALTDPTIANIYNIASAGELASTVNPNKASEYGKQVLGAMEAIVKPENMNDFISEQYHLVRESTNGTTEEIVAKLYEEGGKHFTTLADFHTQYPQYFPKGFAKRYIEQFNTSLFDSIVDLDLIPKLQADAETAVKNGKGKDTIITMKAQAALDMGALGKLVQKTTGGAVTRAEFERQVLPRINAAISHLEALAALNDTNTKSAEDSYFQGFKTDLQVATRNVKEGDIFETGTKPLFIDAESAQKALQYDVLGKINLTEDERNLAFLSAYFVKKEHRQALMGAIAAVKDENADISNFDLAQRVMEGFNLPEKDKRQLRRALELRFEGAANEHRLHPEREKLVQRAVATGAEFEFKEFTTPIIPEKLPFDETLGIINENLQGWFENYQQRASLRRTTDREGNVTEKEKRRLQQQLGLVSSMDPEDTTGIQKNIRNVLRSEGDAWSAIYTSLPDLQNRYRIEPTPQLRQQVSDTLATTAGIDDTQRRILESIVPYVVANEPGFGVDSDGQITDPLTIKGVITRAIKQRFIQGTTAIAPFVNYQADLELYSPTGDFFGFDGYSFTDERSTGKTRTERDAGYLIEMMRQSAIVEIDPRVGDAKQVDNDNSDFTTAIQRAANNPAMLRNLPVDENGNFRYIIIDPETNKPIGATDQDIFIITLPAQAPQEEYSDLSYRRRYRTVKPSKNADPTGDL